MSRSETSMLAPNPNSQIVAIEIKGLLNTLKGLAEFKKNNEDVSTNSHIAYIDSPDRFYSIAYGEDRYGLSLSILRFQKVEDGGKKQKKFDASLDLTTEKTIYNKVRLNNKDKICTGFEALMEMDLIFPEFFK